MTRPFLALGGLLVAAALAAPAVAAPAQPEAHAAPLVSLPMALMASGSAEAPAAGPVALRRQVSVSGDVIRLGDLFSGGVGQPERAVAHAPAVGESVTLDARWLAATARAHGLDWRPASTADRVEVTREGRYIGSGEILAALRDALSERGLGADAELETMGALQPILVPASSAALVSVIDASYDARSGRFSAVLALPDGARERTLRLSGRAYETIEVPVVTRAVPRDGVIGAADIDWVSLRAHEVMAGVVTDPADLIGKAAHRTLRAGEPVRLRDLGDPSLVEKGQTVTMILRTPLMTLTAKGRAMENGPMGATVRVQNMRSNKTVLGVVTADRTVVVESAQAAAVN